MFLKKTVTVYLKDRAKWCRSVIVCFALYVFQSKREPQRKYTPTKADIGTRVNTVELFHKKRVMLNYPASSRSIHGLHECFWGKAVHMEGSVVSWRDIARAVKSWQKRIWKAGIQLKN